MIDEPYRWVEAIANRREYIETELASGSPIVVLETREGLLALTLGGDRQKIFEIYDRIAMAAIGHPADIERLRMLALEVASTEGFTRSPGDVALRRLVSYSLAPAVKAAFEQIYNPPYLVRVLFIELGRNDVAHPSLLMALDYDGSFRCMIKGASPLASGIASTPRANEALQRMLTDYKEPASLRDACKFAARCWSASSLAGTAGESGIDPVIAPQKIEEHLREQSASGMLEAALLAEKQGSRVCFRKLTANELADVW